MLKRCAAACLLVIILFLVFGCGGNSAFSKNEQEKQDTNEEAIFEEVELMSESFNLELAITPEKRTEGLKGRKGIDDDEGMLFVFPDEPPFPAEVDFWMKNCLTPIDLIFLDRDGRISAIHEMNVPEPDTPDEELERYSSYEDVQFAIEIRGGRVSELGLRVGDKIDMDIEYLLKVAE